MKSTLFNYLVCGFGAMAMMACGSNGTNKNENMKTEKIATEIPNDSIIKLLEPDKSLNVSLMEALSNRQSQREFADKQLSLEDLSSLLWAANGINREDGKRTAPSAVNAQDIDIYVCLESGVFLYDAKQNQLTRVCDTDLREKVADKQPMQAPVFLVMVADISRYPQDLASQRQLVESFACMDAGYVSGNIGLYCAAANLATVPRASMDKNAIVDALHLTASQLPILNNPVGYLK